MEIQNLSIANSTNVQVGDYSQMQTTCTNFFTAIGKEIDASNASNADKVNAKSKLVELASNPLLSTIFGGLGIEAIKKLIGF